jgi:hypothetical protein
METGKVRVTIICSCCVQRLTPDASMEFEFTDLFLFCVQAPQWVQLIALRQFLILLFRKIAISVTVDLQRLLPRSKNKFKIKLMFNLNEFCKTLYTANKMLKQ